MPVKHVQINPFDHILCISSLKQQGIVSHISLNVPVDTASRWPSSVITGMTVVTAVMRKTVVGPIHTEDNTLHLFYQS